MIRFFDPKSNTIHVDLDGVLADFDKFVLQNVGRTFTHNVGPAGDKEMWTFLQNVPNLYFKLELTPYAKEMWELVNSFGANVEILTAIPRRTSMPTAEQDKRDWVAKHFGHDVHVKIGPFSRDKWKHAKPGDILIDDRPDNIREWINNGFGIGIFHEYNDYPKTAERIKLMVTELERFNKF